MSKTEFKTKAHRGVSSPWLSVQEYIPILKNGKLMLISGIPGTGKSANLMQWELHAAENGRNVAVFSFEMGVKQLLTRALSHYSRIPLHRLRKENGIEENEWPKRHEAVRNIKELSIEIDDSGRLTVEDIRARTLRIHDNEPDGLGLIVVDCLQLVKPAISKSFNSTSDEARHILRELKELALELECPVIVAAHLNRQVENHANTPPCLENMKDSRAIEQIADIIAFLHRHDGRQSSNDGFSQDQNICDFIVAKNRNGQTGVAMLRHRLECSTFEDGDGLQRPRPQQEESSSSHQRRPPAKTWKSAPDYRPRQTLQ